MKKPTPNLTHLLNKVEALLTSEAGTMNELVAWLDSSQPRVHEWIMGRKYEPGGEITCRLQMWVETKQAELLGAGIGSKPHTAFAREFTRISKEHPSEV